MKLQSHEYIELHDALARLFDHPKTNGYARAYIHEALEHPRRSMNRVQLLYVLNNITHLRDIKGETRVKDARAIIKSYSTKEFSI